MWQDAGPVTGKEQAMDRTIRTLATLAGSLFIGGGIAILSVAAEPRGTGFIMLAAGVVCAVVAVAHSIRADRKDKVKDKEQGDTSEPV